ncbi:MAG: hypothetical protein P4L83_02345 [Nevskia sp.]|nr:hypothetical protein [Nevskia sp.]
MQQSAPAAEAPVESHLACASSLLGLLEQERQALESGDPEQLSAICRDKSRTLIQLGGLLASLKQPGAKPLPADQRRPLQQLILLCSKQTDANSALLEARASRSRRSLRALQADIGQYDRRGRGQYGGIPGRVRGSA